MKRRDLIGMLVVAVLMGGFGRSMASAGEVDPKVLVQQLGATDEKMRIDAQWALLRMRERAAALIEALKSEDKDVRYQATRILGDIGAGAAVGALVERARGTNKQDASNARFALARIGGPEAVEVILEAWPKMDVGDRAFYCPWLGAMGDSRAIEPLIQLLGARGRPEPAEALGHFRGPRVREALEDAIKNDPTWAVYYAARQALYRLDTGYEPTLLETQARIARAIRLMPEPAEGAEEYLRELSKASGEIQAFPGPGPKIEDFVTQAEIDRAEDAIVRMGQKGETMVAEMLIQELRSESRNTRRFESLLVRIGRPAVPTLQIGAVRGNEAMVKRCKGCIEAIGRVEAAKKDAANAATTQLG